MSKLLFSVGGPFPFDRSFRGQNVVQWDYINSALKKGYRSSVVAQDYKPDVSGYNVFEAQQKKIAKKAFNSALEIRQLRDVEKAKATGDWGTFFGLDQIERQLDKGGNAHCVMHYYNARFMDGVNAAEAARTKYNGALDGVGHYVLHVNPDQLILNNKPFDEWVKSDFAREMVERLGIIVESSFFKSLIAVSKSTKEMWLDLLKQFGVCDMRLAESKIKVVPNGTDTFLYQPLEACARKTARDNLGFGDNVEKIVLVMTRPSSSKGIKRIHDIMSAFDRSSNPEMKQVGFVVALPETGIATRNFVEKLDRMENLINEGRLKVTIDVSKVLQNDSTLLDEIQDILKYVPLSYSDRCFYVPPISYPLTAVADVMLHVPKAEAFGLVVSEALLAGCGVVTTNAGGILEVVKNANGQAQILDSKNMKTGDAIDAIMKSKRVNTPNPEMTKQFSIENKIDQVLHDDIQK